MLQCLPLYDLILIDRSVQGVYVAVKGNPSLRQTLIQTCACLHSHTQKHTLLQPHSDLEEVLVRVFACYETKRWTLSCLKALLGVSGALSRVMLLVPLSTSSTDLHTVMPTICTHTLCFCTFNGQHKPVDAVHNFTLDKPSSHTHKFANIESPDTHSDTITTVLS